jgi:stage II sporulation protein AB (anti-sigma F factor)
VRVRLFDDNSVEISVRDRGRGIPDIAAARTPLFTTGGDERSGMGFSIMESFMDSLNVRSTPERGTTVTMTRRISPRGGAR